MKKTIAIALVAVMLLSFVACSGGVTKESLVGNWEVTSVKLDGGDDLIGTVLSFDEDNHYDWKYSGITFMSGEYKISGSFVYLDEEKELFTINGDTLTIKDASGEMTLTRK